MGHTAADFMWEVPGECEGWCVTCAGHRDLAPHTPSHRALQRMLVPVVCYCVLWQSFGDSRNKKRCFGSVKMWPYLLRLLTAMHTARINASTTRATTMISQSVGTDGEGREHVNVFNVVLPFHRTAKTQSLLLPLRCHTLFLASMNVCLVCKVFPCKSNTFSSFSYTQAAQIKSPVNHSCLIVRFNMNFTDLLQWQKKHDTPASGTEAGWLLAHFW